MREQDEHGVLRAMQARHVQGSDALLVEEVDVLDGSVLNTKIVDAIR